MLSLKGKKKSCPLQTDRNFHTISLLFNPIHESREPEVWSTADHILERSWSFFFVQVQVFASLLPAPS